MISNWNNASANAWVDYDGKWWFVGAGVAWHAGAVLPGMPGNYDAIGIDPTKRRARTWSPALLSSLRRGTAAIMRAMKQPASDLHFHKTICSPVGRKSDPSGLDLASERNTVRALMGRTDSEEFDDMDQQTFKQLVRDGFKWAIEDAKGIDPILIDKAVQRALAGPVADINRKLDDLAAKVDQGKA